jgi:nucleoside-diphosphate-sugar epimerase
MNAPVLVTGGAGCIGIQVCRELDRRGIEVHLLDLGEQIARVRKAPSGEGEGVLRFDSGCLLDS